MKNEMSQRDSTIDYQKERGKNGYNSFDIQSRKKEKNAFAGRKEGR